MKERIMLLKSMHTMVQAMNNESAYMTWIYVVPDCPEKDDWEYIAEDDERMSEVVQLFRKLYGKYGNELFCGGMIEGKRDLKVF